MECNHNHRYNIEFLKLPADQSGDGRHRCAGCAYEKGYQLGRSGIVVDDVTTIINIDEQLEYIHTSQAGTVRHKSAKQAFINGYKDGATQLRMAKRKKERTYATLHLN